jgi:PRTRC genetic system protein D
VKIGVDVGYSAVKAIAASDKSVYFPSVVGTPDRARFAVNGSIENIILAPAGLEKRLVGKGAILQSRFGGNPREDREWITNEKYLYLMATAFSELTAASRVDFKIVTGLPVAFYSDKDAVRDRFLGEHRVEREGRPTQVFRVTECRVVPQPFGTVLSEALSAKGKILDNGLATGNIGIIDVGGKTTNLLSVHRLAEISRETGSVNLGAWDAMREVRRYYEENFPGLEEKRNHEIVADIQQKRVRYYGQDHDISPEVGRALQAMGNQILDEASQLWGNGARLDAILVTGGGALLLGEFITSEFPHARIVSDPVHANARGYYNFCQRL